MSAKLLFFCFLSVSVLILGLYFFSDILRGVATASQTVTATTAPTPSLLSQIGGVAATGLGLAGQLGYRPFAKDNTGLGSFNFNLGGSK